MRGLPIGTTILLNENENETGTADGKTGQDYVLTERWILFSDAGQVQRFVTNISMTRTDGSDYHHHHRSILIENIPVDFELSSNDTNAVTSNISAGVRSRKDILPNVNPCHS
jgi:hypothetical protein